jgi:hypothetical protein
LAVLMLTACGPDGFEPGSDLGALRFDPPPSYREMWTLAEACSGRRGAFERIRWWVVPGVETFEYSPEKPYADGLWSSDGDLTLAGGALSHPMVVRHEMLHALGFGDDHPSVPFADPCRATWESWDRTEVFLELPQDLAVYSAQVVSAHPSQLDLLVPPANGRPEAERDDRREEPDQQQRVVHGVGH